MRYTHNAVGTPDWLLMGIPLKTGGVLVFASDKLGGISLSGEMYTENMQEFATALSQTISYGVVYSLSTNFTHAVYAKGETYAEAVVTLFRKWSPREPERTEIEPQRGLPTQTDRLI